MLKPNEALPFTKMHGLGNDFVIIDGMTHSFNIKSLSIPSLADRHTGIGFDQLLVIEPSREAAFFVRIFNADGSEAEQCGNGLRCIARYVHEEKLISHSEFSLATKAGHFPIVISDYNHIRVSMGIPAVINKALTLVFPQEEDINVTTISLGNPHTIVNVTDKQSISFEHHAPLIAKQPHFPSGTNVGWMTIINPHQLKLRTLERGAGETYACGSNACAAVTTAILHGWVEQYADVECRLGSLSIEWDGPNHPIFQTGPAVRVYDGLLNFS